MDTLLDINDINRGIVSKRWMRAFDQLNSIIEDTPAHKKKRNSQKTMSSLHLLALAESAGGIFFVSRLSAEFTSCSSAEKPFSLNKRNVSESEYPFNNTILNF